jgi:16S rRNA (adenine1518-N6/adenine1519-N6)-dimethyltransferase
MTATKMHSHFHPRKRFGQHFLTDEAVLEQMASIIGIASEDYIVEIGPGRGALTQYLLPLAKKIDAIEIDRDLAAYLQQHYANQENLTIHNADVLHFDWGSLLKLPPLKRIVGNLPYNITTPLLFQLFDWSSQIKNMHFLLQKEVVERLTAPVGSHNYSRLTVMAQYHAQLTMLFAVPASAFSPPPRVESAFVRIIPYQTPPIKAQNLTTFAEVVKEAFSYRRKTLANSLRKLITTAELESLNIDPHWRPQQITVENFVKISNILLENNREGSSKC